MSSLTIAELKDKLAMVERDLEDLRKQGESGRKLEILSEYKEYIKDEIRMLEIEGNL
jgi:uncharacterized protein YeeX (DUF496 family)